MPKKRHTLMLNQHEIANHSRQPWSQGSDSQLKPQAALFYSRYVWHQSYLQLFVSLACFYQELPVKTM